MNKKTLIFNIFLLGILVLPISAQAQSKQVFQLFSNEKQPVSVPTIIPAPSPSPTQEVVEDTFDLSDLKNQPLPVRRKIVANELDDIWNRLSILLEKAKIATVRLGENDIDTTLSITKLDEASALLVTARLSIDSLLIAANDPANEAAVTLMIDTATFKEVVITSEADLRGAREAIIVSLGHLKAAVSAKVAPAQ